MANTHRRLGPPGAPARRAPAGGRRRGPRCASWSGRITALHREGLDHRLAARLWPPDARRGRAGARDRARGRPSARSIVSVPPRPLPRLARLDTPRLSARSTTPRCRPRRSRSTSCPGRSTRFFGLSDRSGAHAVIVAEDEGVVGPWSTRRPGGRSPYATSVEDSVYIHRDYQGRGIGRTHRTSCCGWAPPTASTRCSPASLGARGPRSAGTRQWVRDRRDRAPGRPQVRLLARRGAGASAGAPRTWCRISQRRRFRPPSFVVEMDTPLTTEAGHDRYDQLTNEGHRGGAPSSPSSSRSTAT